MKKIVLSAWLLAALTLVGCSGNGESQTDESDSSGKKTEIEFFSNKAENIDTLKGIIADFEKDNPDISVNLQTPPDADTVLRTRLVKNDVPDIVAQGIGQSYGEFAREGLFMNLEGEDYMDTVQPAYLEMQETMVNMSGDKETKGQFAVPYSGNVNGVIYNKKIFSDLGMKIPTTWDDFIGLLEKAKENDITPIEFAFNDSWTIKSFWNPLAALLVDNDFHIKKTEGKMSFEDDYQEVAQKVLQLADYGEGDMLGTSYDNGNKKFANGEALFLLQGNWTIPELLKNNPDIDLGFFVFPSTNDSDKNLLLTGLDVLFSISADTKHPDEAKRFIAYMMQPEVNEKYNNEQLGFPTIKGVEQENPIFEALNPYFADSRITSYVADNFYPSGMGQENIMQEFIMEKDVDKFLKKMDTEWK